MNLKILAIAFTCLLFSCNKKTEEGTIIVDWIEDLQGDYSFTQKWNYPENIFMNSFGQLVCDGICDPLVDNLRNNEGRIYADSLHRYYQLVDTTHIYHTFSGEAQCYEWNGTDFAFAYRRNDTVICYTTANIATHSVLRLSVTGNRCIPIIELNSITTPDIHYFECNGGYIKIDNTMFEKGILKAEFNLTFQDTLSPGKPMWWKGCIYTRIT